MYPLSMKLENGIGYAVANAAAEHAALTEQGFGPGLVSKAKEPEHTVESVRATLDAAGIEYDKRLGLAKLVELLPT